MPISNEEETLLDLGRQSVVFPELNVATAFVFFPCKQDEMAKLVISPKMDYYFLIDAVSAHLVCNVSEIRESPRKFEE